MLKIQHFLQSKSFQSRECLMLFNVKQLPETCFSCPDSETLSDSSRSPCPSETPAVDFDASVKNGVMIRAGELLKLPAIVTGRPQPEVKWAKDEAEVDKERMIVETEGKNTVLFIKKAVRADHGKYQVTGTNSSGTKTAETRVDVMGQF